MRRLFWVTLGATAGVLVVRRITRTAESYTPQGLAGAVASVGDGIRVFADEVRAGMAERESELRGALGLDDGAGPDADAVGDLTGRPSQNRGGR